MWFITFWSNICGNITVLYILKIKFLKQKVWEALLNIEAFTDKHSFDL